MHVLVERNGLTYFEKARYKTSKMRNDTQLKLENKTSKMRKHAQL